MPTPTLALTMIVRNEEAHIGTALQHVRRFADEVVIVDTGSTDRTKELCVPAADKMLDFAWCDDFSKARNFGLAHCTADFVIWLDADDMVMEATADRISALVHGSSGAVRNWDVLLLPYVYARDATGNPTMIERRARIFRNGLGMAFEFPIHEILAYGPDARVRERRDIAIVHNKVAPSESSRERNRRILRKAVATEEYGQSPRLWRLLAVEEPPALAIPVFAKVFAEFPDAYPVSVLSGLHVAFARKLMILRRFTEAEAQLRQAISVLPRWREPYFYLAQVLWYLKRHVEALQALDATERIPRPGGEVSQFNPALYHGTVLLEWRFFTLRSLGRHEEMRAVIRKALAIEPDNARFLKRQRKWGA
jgi:glycosyltransferase involved in cell wall biosynthesis